MLYDYHSLLRLEALRHATASVKSTALVEVRKVYNTQTEGIGQ